jgi:4-carboxymuconolactone decarboxylase
MFSALPVTMAAFVVSDILVPPDSPAIGQGKRLGVQWAQDQQEETMAQAPSSASRDAVRNTVPKMIEVTEKVLFGDIWERPELSKRDRSLIVCAVLTATYRPEQLRGHLQRALDNGLTKTEISEMITHVAFYAGWPASMSAANIAREIFEANP